MMRGAVFWLVAAVGVFLVASTVLRRHVDYPSMWSLLLALVLYSMGNLMMVRIMRDTGMAVAVSLSAVAQLVLANLVAVTFFGERPSLWQTAGILLGVVAVVLILLPTAGDGR